MRAAAGWTCRSDYTRFLSLQYAARLPVEEWLAAHAPDDLRPPEQCALIAEDLTALGEELPEAADAFALPVSGNGAAETALPPAAALGAAWVLAGSALGNRAILKEVRRTASESGEAAWPEHFLGNDAMLDFWKGLRRQIEAPATSGAFEAASMAASAVFDHFIAVAAEAQTDETRKMAVSGPGQ